MKNLFPFPKFDLNSIDSILQARKLVSAADKNKIASYVATEEDVRDRIDDLVFLINLLDGPVVLKTKQRGYGLFAEKDYKVPERVTFYGGIKGYGLKGDYVVEGKPDVDGYYGFLLTERGRFINEYGADVDENKKYQNVKMLDSMKFITTKVVKKGEEFFENYGKYYVRNYGNKSEPEALDLFPQNSPKFPRIRQITSNPRNSYLIEEKYQIDATPEVFLNVPIFLTQSQQTIIDGKVQLLTLDSPIEFIFTPGHSPDSVCYIWKQYLFTGDSLYDFKIPEFSEFSNIDLWIASLQKIKQIILNRQIERIFGSRHDSMEFGRALERIVDWINFLEDKRLYC